MAIIIPKSNDDIQKEIGERFKSRRLMLGFSRERLSSRSGVPSSTIKNFELTGNISLKAMVALARSLENIGTMNQVMPIEHPKTIEQFKNLDRTRGLRCDKLKK